MQFDAETQARRRRASDQQQAYRASHGIAPPQQAFDAMDGILAAMPMDGAQAPAEPEGEGHDPVVFLHPAMLPGANLASDEDYAIAQYGLPDREAPRGRNRSRSPRDGHGGSRSRSRDFDSRVIMGQILILLREIRAGQVVSDERYATLLLLEERFDTVRYGPAAPADAPGPPPAE
jgi:hypothetical protein